MEQFFVTPTSVRNLNKDGLPYNFTAAEHGAAHGKIVGGVVATAASLIIPGGGKVLEVIASAAAGAGLQTAGEKVGEKLGALNGGFLGHDPGPVNPSLQAGYDALNIAGYVKTGLDVGKAVLKNVAKNIMSAAPKVQFAK